MRMPPLPRPSKPLTLEQMAQRVVGDRPAEVTAPITISAYDPNWPVRYRREESRIRAALGDRALAVEHVGSTVVPGLAAKDRIDIDLIVANPADEDAYLPELAAAGYVLRTRSRTGMSTDAYGPRSTKFPCTSSVLAVMSFFATSFFVTGSALTPPTGIATQLRSIG